MTKPVSSVPNVFGTQTSTIPLSYLDTNFNVITQYINDLNNYSNYIADSGSTNAIILNYPAGISSATIATGTTLWFKALNTNTGATTITVQVNGSTISSAANIVNEDGTSLTAGQILSGGIYACTNNGSNWILGAASSGGGGGGGASAGGAVYENTQSITSNYTMTTNKNGFSVGPISVDPGITVTIPAGSRWVIM